MLVLSSCFCFYSGGSGRVGGSRFSGLGVLGFVVSGIGRFRGVFRFFRLRFLVRLV